MSLFQNAFEWFAGEVEAFIADGLEVVAPGELETEALGPQAVTDAGDFDPFAWAGGAEDGMVWVATEPPLPSGGPEDVSGAMTAPGAGLGGGQDHFWSTQFSAGNSNADNTEGYVNVPGHGPVSYGM